MSAQISVRLEKEKKTSVNPLQKNFKIVSGQLFKRLKKIFFSKSFYEIISALIYSPLSHHSAKSQHASTFSVKFKSTYKIIKASRN